MVVGDDCLSKWDSQVLFPTPKRSRVLDLTLMLHGMDQESAPISYPNNTTHPRPCALSTHTTQMLSLRVLPQSLPLSPSFLYHARYDAHSLTLSHT